MVLAVKEKKKHFILNKIYGIFRVGYLVFTFYYNCYFALVSTIQVFFFQLTQIPFA